VTQQYVPDDLVGADYYRPTDHGAERAVGERLPRLRRIVRGAGPSTDGPAADDTGTGVTGTGAGTTGTGTGTGGKDQV
jgi:putative ATPase